MESHYEFNDESFERAFAGGSFPASVFNHEAHVRLAWVHVTKYGVDQAVENVNTQLLAFVTQLGAAEKYNKTLTTAAVKAVHHFVCRSDSKSFTGFIAEFPRLVTGFKALMAAHYDIDIFNSPLAKKEYLAPQLLPFD